MPGAIRLDEIIPDGVGVGVGLVSPDLPQDVVDVAHEHVLNPKT